jgi:hypothetical protein
MFKRLRVSVSGVAAAAARLRAAQQPRPRPARPAPRRGATICGQAVPRRVPPPDGSGPVVYLIAPCFEAREYVARRLQTYLYYIQTKASEPSQGNLGSLQDDTETSIRDDFKRLWGTNFLDNLSIDVEDYPSPTA